MVDARRLLDATAWAQDRALWALYAERRSEAGGIAGSRAVQRWGRAGCSAEDRLDCHWAATPAIGAGASLPRLPRLRADRRADDPDRHPACSAHPAAPAAAPGLGVGMHRVRCRVRAIPVR